MAKLTLSAGFSSEQILSATPSTSVKGTTFDAQESLSFLRATSETRGEGTNAYEVLETEYLSSSKGVIRIPLSELIRMKKADGTGIIPTGGDSEVLPPQSITIVSSKGRLKRGVSADSSPKRNDFQYPTNCYSLAEAMFDEDDATVFNFNKLIASELIKGDITPLQDYVVS